MDNTFDQQNPRVIMSGISKRFGEVQALNQVNFDLKLGEVHSILGENGAGKTTLMNVLSGLYRADEGQIIIEGKRVNIQKPGDAIIQGVGMVHQHFELIPNFTALENIIIGKEGEGRLLDLPRQRKEVERLMILYGLVVDLDKKVKNLAIGVQQKVEILKVLFHGAKILILDEPTTMLTPQEVDFLFQTVKMLVQKGLSVVIITHKIKEVLAISDRITVMRRGQVVTTLPTQDASRQHLVELMIGQKLSVKQETSRFSDEPKDSTSKPVVETVGLGIKDLSNNWSVKDVSIQIRAGEIVGLVGVAGNGQRETAEAILGLRQVAEGEILSQSRDITHLNIRQRLLSGLTLIPEDRINQGILPDLSLAMNLILGPHNVLFGKGILFKSKQVNALAEKAISEYRILAPNVEIECRLLSGGNIQKVLLARAFLQGSLVEPVLLIAFNPTRGLDVMSSEFVHEKLIEHRKAGHSVLLISEDLDESLQMCDRIYVMYQGKVAAEFLRDEFDPYEIGGYMTQVQGQSTAVS